MVRVTKNLKLVGLGRLPKKRRQRAVTRTMDYTGALPGAAGVIVDTVSDISGKDFKLTKAERAKALKYVQRHTMLNRKQSEVLVNKILSTKGVSAGNFWKWLGHAAGTVAGFIPGLGGVAKEAINSAVDGRAFNGKRAALDTAIGLLPGGSLVKGAVNGVLSATGARKAIGAGKKAKAKTKANDPRKVRGRVVSSLMKKHNLSLPQASQLLKKMLAES